MNRCRHCNALGNVYARELCSRCWHTPSILALYPRPESKARTTVSPIHEPRLADEPTEATPGSEEKLVVMENRIAAGRQPFHPGDYRERKYRR